MLEQRLVVPGCKQDRSDTRFRRGSNVVTSHAKRTHRNIPSRARIASVCSTFVCTEDSSLRSRLKMAGSARRQSSLEQHTSVRFDDFKDIEMVAQTHQTI